jgi:hypothetical protein
VPVRVLEHQDRPDQVHGAGQLDCCHMEQPVSLGVSSFAPSCRVVSVVAPFLAARRSCVIATEFRFGVGDTAGPQRTYLVVSARPCRVSRGSRGSPPLAPFPPPCARVVTGTTTTDRPSATSSTCASSSARRTAPRTRRRAS